MNPKDKTKIKVSDLLKSHRDGLTIKDIMDKTKLARHTVLARLHRMVGEGKVRVREVNRAKLHYWNRDLEKENEKHPKLVHLKEKHLKKPEKKVEKKSKIDVVAIKQEIEEELRSGKIKKDEAKFKEQREPIKQTVDKTNERDKRMGKKYIWTGVPGFDDLFEKGIPEGSAVLIAGGAGSGKTILTLQVMDYQVKKGKKCLYMSFEESEKRLISHMKDFGWDPDPYIKKKELMVKRFNPFDITRSVDALLMKAKGELLIDVDPVILPEGFKPDFIFVDSLTAIASAFVGKEDSYRVYIEQLFRFFENIGATSFLITETKQIPTVFSQTGVEEFLADSVIVLYNIKRGNVRENAIEVLKLRGADHQKRIVAFEVTDSGIVVYPEQEVFGDIE